MEKHCINEKLSGDQFTGKRGKNIALSNCDISGVGLTEVNRTRLSCLSLFWHFLVVVWICVFTEVYLM